MNRKLIHVAIALLAGCARLPPAQVLNPPKSQAVAVVFDIDGTLTPDVNSFNEVRPDAANAVRSYSEKGYKVIYLSTRISFLQERIPSWLKENGFPESSIHLAQNNEDDNDPAAFKLRIMKQYQAQGWQLVGGYGDSSTDFDAYAKAGIPKSQVFALQRRGEMTCRPGLWQECLPGWTNHLSFIDSRRD